MSRVLVRSSHGIFFFHPTTGEVKASDIDLTKEFGDPPVRVNVDELRSQPVPELLKHHLKDGLLPEYDVLDVGYWTEDGSYEPPEEDWRIERDERRGE